MMGPLVLWLWLRGPVLEHGAVFRRAIVPRVLPHLRMLLSLDRYGADRRRVRGFINHWWIGGLGVSRSALHTQRRPRSRIPAGATTSDMR